MSELLDDNREILWISSLPYHDDAPYYEVGAIRFDRRVVERIEVYVDDGQQYFKIIVNGEIWCRTPASTFEVFYK